MASYFTERPRKMANMVAMSTLCTKPVVVKYHLLYLNETWVLCRNGIGNEQDKSGTCHCPRKQGDNKESSGDVKRTRA